MRHPALAKMPARKRSYVIDHGGTADGAAERIAELTEAREVLLEFDAPASEPDPL